MRISNLVKQVCCVTLVSVSAAHASNKSSIVDKIYVRVGGGAMWDNKFKDHGEQYHYISKAPKTAPLYFVGLGYKFTDALKGDAHLQYMETKYKAGGNVYDIVVRVDQKIRTTALLFNAYYDINVHPRVVPYAVVGVGAGYNQVGDFKIHTSNPSGATELELIKGKNRSCFIWNIGAGLKFNMTQNTALEVGYKWSDMGRISIKNSEGLTDKQNLRGQQVVGSLIYNF